MKINSLQDMQSLGARLASGLQRGDVIAVEGALGVGKSELARAVIRAFLGEPELDVPSPSFSLMQSYQHQNQELLHFDLYRLGSADELIELGLPEILLDAITIIEWPERAGGMLPANTQWIKILDEGGDKRRIIKGTLHE